MVSHKSNLGELGKWVREFLVSKTDDHKNETNEDAVEFAEFQEMGLQYLEELGIVERKKDAIVVDTDKLKASKSALIPKLTPERMKSIMRPHVRESIGQEIDRTQTRISLKSFEPFQAFVGNNWNEFLFNVFKGKSVLSKQDAATNQRTKKIKPKSLFYSPASKKEAFDPEAIRKAEFYIGPWEVQDDKADVYAFDGNPNPTTFDQASLAAAIFHPAYGDGRRDETGALTVRDAAGVRQPISVNWLAAQHIHHNDTIVRAKKGGLFASPVTALESPELADLATVLHPDDFNITARNEQSDLYTNRRPINNKGLVMFKGVRYSLGAEYGKLNIKTASIDHYEACVVSEETGGILAIGKKGEIELVATFNLVSPETSELKTVVSGTSRYKEAGRSMVRITKLENPQTVFSLTSDQGESFDMQAFLEYKRSFAKETKISLNTLTPLEQAVFLKYYQNASEEKRTRLKEFSAVYKADGLKTFLVAALDEKYADAIFAIQEKFGAHPENVQAIFKKFEAISKRAQNVDTELQEFLVDTSNESANELDKPRVTEEIVRRGARLLEEFALSPDAIDQAAVAKKLEQINVDLQTFGSIFKIASANGVPFESVRGFDYQNKPALSAPEIQQMEELINKNYRDSKLLAGVLAGFRGALQNPRNTFDVLKRDGKVVAFSRFEKKVDVDGRATGEVEFASFNTDPAYQRSGIGNAMMERTLDDMARQPGVTIVAETDPFSAICPFYIEKAGFVATGIQEYKSTGQFVFAIRRNDHESRPTDGKWYILDSKKELVEWAREAFWSGNILTRFHEKDGKFFVATAIKKTTQ